MAGGHEVAQLLYNVALQWLTFQFYQMLLYHRPPVHQVPLLLSKEYPVAELNKSIKDSNFDTPWKRSIGDPHRSDNLNP